jgi:hypothetical protein
MNTAKLTTHQKDLIIDQIIRVTDPITIADLHKRAQLVGPQITAANIQNRVDYDVKMDRAVMIGPQLVSFKLDRMATRRLKTT